VADASCYCAQNPAAALLEILVHFEIDIHDLPVRYRLLKIHAPDDLHVDRISVDELPPDRPDKIDLTRALGDGWLGRGSAVLLTVPSAVVPETFNVLLNPSHDNAKRITSLIRVSTRSILDWSSNERLRRSL